MKKPTKKTFIAYDFSECRDYINKKYKCNIRDFARSTGEGKEYQDFWHWICNTYSPNNGSFLTFSREDDTEKDWQRTILNYFLDEFGENDEVIFYVDW